MAGVVDDQARFAYLAEGNAKQARKRVAADVIVRNRDGHILLVNPTYKPYWDLPGGMAEANESPRDAARRELCEELDLRIDVGRLLVLDWVSPTGPWDDLLHFIFDGGVLSEQAAQPRIADGEISEWAMCTVEEAVRRLRRDIAQRLLRALAALDTDSIDYGENFGAAVE